MATSASEDTTTLKEEVCDEAETSKSTKLEISSKNTGEDILQEFYRSLIAKRNYCSAISQPVITQAIPNTETPVISQPTAPKPKFQITTTTYRPRTSPSTSKLTPTINTARPGVHNRFGAILHSPIPISRSPPDDCNKINILIIGGEGCGKTTVKNHLQIPGGQETAVIDTFGIEYDTFFKETRDKVLGYYRNVHLIVLVLKYEEEPSEEAIQNQFGLFDKYFTQEVHAITVLVITHCERKKNEEVIETYTQLCPTDRARLGIIPVDFTENPSGPWKGKIIKKMKDDKEILQNLVLKCKDSVPASQIFKEQPSKVPRKKDIAPNLVEI